MLTRSEIDALFRPDLPEPEHWERTYPPRDLPAGALVTRFAPSPTGFMHIGGIYVAMIARDVARRSGGSYFVRVEDTDQARGVEGAMEQFDRAFEYFSIQPTEGEGTGAYGPYRQSQRADLYLTFVRHLLRQGQAYLCFATREELAEMAARQQAAKVPTGYYGRWATWRDAPAEQVRAALAEDRPYVVRFRSPGRPGVRMRYVDQIRGPIEADENRNDVVILKASDQALPLPTYHFAHVVDDHLMRVNLVIRADEWISSVPVHHQLSAALGFEPFSYAHIAPLLKQEGGSKRKLSKRKDPEASVDYYIEAGYPVEAVLYYLRGLANGRLAELPLAEALTAPIRIEECGVSGALIDLPKLDHISADVIVGLSGDEILTEVTRWASTYDPELVELIDAERDLARRALAIEREGVDNPRKDLKKWSEFRRIYGYFFTRLAPTPVLEGPLASIDPAVVRGMMGEFAASYQHLDDPQEWFNQIRELAARHGFAGSQKEFKANPGRYHGSIREPSQIIRIALTGSTRSPDLFQVARALGREETVRRVSLLA
ncbi:MAG: glutamate--tRNA ligase [Micromonosporaceae bacterium]|nr:glutamate--tRNA ligase [Micromonosporaceae bacterium]